MTTDNPSGGPTPRTTQVRTRGWALIGIVLLCLLGGFYFFGATSDLVSDAGHGIPVDHDGTFTALAGSGFGQLKATAPGTAGYITTLERGYALHELTFALLFLAVVLWPFRRRARWAWWAAWLPMIANLGYTLTFGVHDPTIFYRSLTADIALPLLLLAHIPAFFRTAARTRALPTSPGSPATSGPDPGHASGPGPALRQ